MFLLFSPRFLVLDNSLDYVPHRYIEPPLFLCLSLIHTKTFVSSQFQTCFHCTFRFPPKDAKDKKIIRILLTFLSSAKHQPTTADRLFIRYYIAAFSSGSSLLLSKPIQSLKHLVAVCIFMAQSQSVLLRLPMPRLPAKLMLFSLCTCTQTLHALTYTHTHCTFNSSLSVFRVDLFLRFEARFQCRIPSPKCPMKVMQI